MDPEERDAEELLIDNNELRHALRRIERIASDALGDEDDEEDEEE